MPQTVVSRLCRPQMQRPLGSDRRRPPQSPRTDAQTLCKIWDRMWGVLTAPQVYSPTFKQSLWILK